MNDNFTYSVIGKDKKGRELVELVSTNSFSYANWLGELRLNDRAKYAQIRCEIELNDLIRDFEWIGDAPYRAERVTQFRQKIGELRRIGGLSYRQVKKYYAVN